MGRFVKGAWREYEPCSAVFVAGQIDDNGYFIKDKITVGEVTEIDMSQLKARGS